MRNGVPRERDGDGDGDGDETRRDETVETSSPRHVNRSERPRSTHGENRGRILFVLSPFFFFFSLFFPCLSAVWVGLERRGRCRERGGQGL